MVEWLAALIYYAAVDRAESFGDAWLVVQSSGSAMAGATSPCIIAIPGCTPRSTCGFGRGHTSGSAGTAKVRGTMPSGGLRKPSGATPCAGRVSKPQFNTFPRFTSVFRSTESVEGLARKAPLAIAPRPAPPPTPPMPPAIPGTPTLQTPPIPPRLPRPPPTTGLPPPGLVGNWAEPFAPPPTRPPFGPNPPPGLLGSVLA